MRERFTSIRGILIQMIVAAVLISVVAVGTAGIHYIKISTREYLDELLMLKCDNIEDRLDSYLDSIVQSVGTVASYASEDIDGMAEINDEELAEHIDDVDAVFRNAIKRTNGIITYYYRISPDISAEEKGFWYQKNQYSAFRKGELTDIEAYSEEDEGRVEWFYVPKRTRMSVWLEPYENKNFDGKKMISYVTPVFSKNRFIGVVGIDYDYDTLIDHIKYDGHFEGAYTFLTDRDGKIIYHPSLAQGVEMSDESKLLSNKSLSNTKDVKRINFDGEDRRITWSRLSNGMMLYLSAPEKSYKQYWFRFEFAFILITVLLLILFTAAAVLIANRISKPLSDLIVAARKIDEGDYDVDLSYNGYNEIGLLTNTMRQLTEHLKAHISDLSDKAYKDALTSVRNKGAFNMYMRGLVETLKNGDDSDDRFGLCIFDCNDLKRINDNFGHHKGDEYIKGACKLICEVYRHSPVFRIGGDEFACVLRGEDYEHRDELRRKFEKKAIEINRNADRPWKCVDVACGFAEYDPETDINVRDVFNRADRDMYKDKERKKAGLGSRLLEEE